MSEAMRIDPQAVLAVGDRLGSTADALRRAVDAASAARFGPDSVAPELRHHGVAYAAGMADLGAVVEAMVGSVAHLVEGFDTASAALGAADAGAGASIRAAGGAP